LHPAPDIQTALRLRRRALQIRQNGRDIGIRITNTPAPNFNPDN
jgi:hypothetical protein